MKMSANSIIVCVIILMGICGIFYRHEMNNICEHRFGPGAKYAMTLQACSFVNPENRIIFMPLVEATK